MCNINSISEFCDIPSQVIIDENSCPTTYPRQSTKSIEKKLAVQLEAPKARALSAISHGRRMRTTGS